MKNKEDLQKKEVIGKCVCCDKKAEKRVRVSLCKDCFRKVSAKVEKEPNFYNKQSVTEEDEYWGLD